jgi:hypothetical protein
MTTATHTTAWAAAVALALLAGCATGGSSNANRSGPTLSAPTTDTAPARETATISPSSTAPSPARATPTSGPANGTATTTETRHQVPTDTTAKTVYDKEWEYRLYRYLPVNERGQAELGMLKSKMRADGWELYRVQVAPVGHSTAIFRRHRKTSALTNNLPPGPGAGSGSAAGTAPAPAGLRPGVSGTGTPEPAGSPSSPPPAPR